MKTETLNEIKRFLPLVYLSGTANDIAPMLGKLTELIQEIDKEIENQTKTEDL